MASNFSSFETDKLCDDYGLTHCDYIAWRAWLLFGLAIMVIFPNLKLIFVFSYMVLVCIMCRCIIYIKIIIFIAYLLRLTKNYIYCTILSIALESNIQQLWFVLFYACDIKHLPWWNYAHYIKVILCNLSLLLVINIITSNPIRRLFVCIKNLGTRAVTSGGAKGALPPPPQ